LVRSQAGFGTLSRAREFGIHPYNVLRGKLQGTGLQAHHIIEQRFVRQVPHPQNSPAVAVTRAEHQVLTNRWRNRIPYGADYNMLTNSQVWDVAQYVYRDFPALLDVARIALGF